MASQAAKFASFPVKLPSVDMTTLMVLRLQIQQTPMVTGQLKSLVSLLPILKLIPPQILSRSSCEALSLRSRGEVRFLKAAVECANGHCAVVQKMRLIRLIESGVCSIILSSSLVAVQQFLLPSNFIGAQQSHCWQCCPAISLLSSNFIAVQQSCPAISYCSPPILLLSSNFNLFLKSSIAAQQLLFRAVQRCRAFS